MPFEFKLPDIGEGIVEGEIVRWLVKEGEHVEEDQPIVEVMTDKATVEIPSPLKGKIAKRIGDEGEVIKVGATMVVIEEKEEEGQSGVKLEPAKPRVDKPKTKLQEPRPTEAPVPAGGPVLATPAVRRLAREMGVELSQVQGSGPRGRVTREDLERFKSAPAEIRPERVKPRPASGEVETIPYRGVRKKIGERLVASKRTAPHFTYVEEVDVTELVRVRKQFQESDKGQKVRLTYLPFLMKAVVRGLKEYPLLNSTLDEEEGVIRLKKYYNIGIATDTPEGLIVPVVRDVDKKDILKLAQEVTGLSEAARAGKAKLEDLKDGTFTITSLGALGGVLATPIINYPEVAILGVHKIAQKPVVRDGQIVVRDMMNLSISL
ncbi:2-oxo acid dehydrogenase subunit E2, partial [Acidobacteria bacterium AH-259-G07]|nr:2-oxo acid dehydrogenase subunit E2 [Acidobacteria bacterium AH-259-G07]